MCFSGPSLLVVGPSHGQEWLWKDQYEVNNLCELHRKRHEEIRGYE